jgi:hypothetical protein
LSGVFSSFNEPLSSVPQQPRSDAENDSEKRDNLLTMLVKPFAAAASSDFIVDHESADVFLKGAAAACMILMLIYAGLKRW